MRAIQFFSYGGPEVLRVVDVDRPTPGANDVLVKMAATSVNPIDAETRQGRLRLLSGRRFPRGTGIDIAGTVVVVGSAVKAFAPGDQVWGVKAGFFARSTGAAAEYMAVEARHLAFAPRNIDLVQAAALPAVGATAVAAVRDHGRVGPGSSVLIRGAAGGVGSAAVQYAHHLGAHVTALASSDSLRFVRELGADVALDRRATRVADLASYDAIIDTVGSDLLALRRHLAPGGRMVTIAFSSPATIAHLAVSVGHGSGRIRTFFGQPATHLMPQLTELVEVGAITPVIQGTYELEQIVAAHTSLEGGGARGKRVIRIAEPTGDA